MLSVVYPDTYDVNEVKETVQKEAFDWMTRYPVPIMATAFDATDAIIRPADTPDAHFIVWRFPPAQQLHSTWNLKEVSRDLELSITQQDLRAVYKDIPFRTGEQIKLDVAKDASVRRKQVRLMQVIAALWFAVIPVSWALIQWLGPNWLAIAVMAYSFWRGCVVLAEISGGIKPSKKDIKKQELDRKKDHYFYHCERNPNGFLRLKIENSEREQRDKTKKEAERLSRKDPSSP
jgi:hypothetical protein